MRKKKEIKEVEEEVTLEGLNKKCNAIAAKQRKMIDNWKRFVLNHVDVNSDGQVGSIGIKQILFGAIVSLFILLAPVFAFAAGEIDNWTSTENGTVRINRVSTGVNSIEADTFIGAVSGAISATTISASGKATMNGELEANADVDINLGSATEEITIDQTNAAGTADVPLIGITDARTGATANTPGEATLLIMSSGSYAVSISNGILAVDDEIDCLGDLTIDPAGNDLIVDATIDATAITVDAGAGIDVKTTGTLDLGVTTADAVDISKTTEITTIKGLLNVDEAVTLDTTLGVTGITDLSELDISDRIDIGGWGYTGEHAELTDTGSDNTMAGFGQYNEIKTAISAGHVMAAKYSRLLVTSNQANDVTMVGAENQFRLRGANVANGVHAGLWAYAEQSGTSVLSGNGTFDAIAATIESASTFTVGATERLSGITIDSSIDAGASGTIDGSANFSAMYIKSNGLDWYNGLYITGCDNAILFDGAATIDQSDANTLTLTETTVAIAGAATVSGDCAIDGKYAVVGGDATTGLMIQAAKITATAALLQTNSFAVAFATAPIVTVSYAEDAGADTRIFTTTITASNFVCSGVADKDFNYIAVGARP